MGLRFRQSFQLFPGVRLNFSKTGVSASFGVPGATLNIGRQGARSTVGVPGTGLSYAHHHRNPGEPQPRSEEFEPHPSFTPALAFQQLYEMREINSASIEELTSHSLVELRELIISAKAQRSEVDDDLHEARTAFDRDSQEIDRRQRSLFRFFYKRRIAELELSIPETAAEIERLEQWRDATHINVSFETGESARRAYASVVRAFDALRQSNRIWDITADRQTHKVIERTSAARNVNRRPVTIDFASSELIQFDGRAMRFANVNGEDIIIYPGMVLMPRADGMFALVDIREVNLDFEFMNFIEDEQVPLDSEIVGETWAKVNKDGSRDLRFSNNYRIPIMLYGKMVFTSAGGIEEEYQFSNAGAAAEFARAFNAYKAALASK